MDIDSQQMVVQCPGRQKEISAKSRSPRLAVAEPPGALLLCYHTTG
jgi:hypothetical protein